MKDGMTGDQFLAAVKEKTGADYVVLEWFNFGRTPGLAIRDSGIRAAWVFGNWVNTEMGRRCLPSGNFHRDGIPAEYVDEIVAGWESRVAAARGGMIEGPA
jgi:hypothetical protein